jgi:cytochrome b561
MDIAKSFTFLTEDERWLEKLGIGIAILLISGVSSVVLIGIVGFFILTGYSIRLLQNVRDGKEKPLPEWDQWAEDMGRGFKFAVAALIWALPIVVFVVPIVIGGSLTDNPGQGAQNFGALILICSGCVMVLYSIFLALMSPGFTIAFAQKETISSALQITPIWRWTQANLGQVVVAVLAYVVASFIIPLVGIVAGLILCVIGLIVTLPLATLATMLVQHHLYGQLAREYPMALE